MAVAVEPQGKQMKYQKPVLPGEIYRSNDIRDNPNRLRRVLAVNVDRVFCEYVTLIGSGGTYRVIPNTRKVWINRKAFHSKSGRGFTLIDSPAPTRRITIEVDGGDDLIVQRLIHGIIDEAREFAGHYIHMTVKADGSTIHMITGSRRFEDLDA